MAATECSRPLSLASIRCMSRLALRLATCPASSGEIASAFETAARSVAAQVSENWTDETLLLEDEMYGETWSRGMTLFYLIAHQGHHRGQMTVLMRQAGLSVPGIYGPSKEEWAAFGAPAMP